MKVLFATGSMQGGGAERVVAVLANELVSRNIKVSIILVRGGSVYALDSRIKLVPVYEEFEITNTFFNKVFRRIVYLPRLINLVRAECSDVVIPVHGGGWNGIFTIIAKIVGSKVIVAEHTSHTHKNINLIRRFERHVLYKFSDAIAVLTKFDFEYYSKILKTTVLIPNPIGFKPISSYYKRKKNILAVGRLNSWKTKGFDNLLKIFSAIHLRHPEWRLEIAGAGDDGMKTLSKLANDLGIVEKINLLGFTNEVDRVMREASILIVTSRHEGFSMVLAEAMSQGCACISFDCEAGPSDIIDHHINGLLIENQNNEKMIDAVEMLMRDEKLRNKLSLEAMEKVKNYSAEKICDRWIDLFNSIGVKSCALCD
jgi:GalNAc-alpha-(1->4)-GalNAc-alpha-(1->3)-diNAcBac-PP-undecaprenol alpha-1,4-N-acetyl-D-galactosaminyltransferase